ncbi:MAG: hypothetical protein ACRCSM_08575 [Sediminibacterium sp.]|jgi:long-subunit fatty acid transport protein|nr:hypothetical protein [Chitinophagaceae bacterium]MCA6446667.1 hypothetical protein [Chitinophagaceae bacterium]
MNKLSLLTGILFISMSLAAQQKKSTSLLDLGIGIGSNQQIISGSWVNYWGLRKSQKFKLGVGVRLTSSFAIDKYYETADARLTSGKTGPGVLFAENIPANIDSFFVGKSQINSLNLSFNSEYQFSSKWSAGFNIDLIGFSFGTQKTGIYSHNGASSVVQAKPTAFNLLLISDNDLGSLNSELFVRYKVDKKWSVRAGTSFLFNEYKTNTKVQVQNCIENDRFRHKSLYGLIALSYHF